VKPRSQNRDLGHPDLCVVYVWAICLHHPDVVFAGDREGGEEVGEDEEVADLGAEVAELEGDFFVFGADVDADERS
jgi:hypothetical protein